MTGEYDDLAGIETPPGSLHEVIAESANALMAKFGHLGTDDTATLAFALGEFHGRALKAIGEAEKAIRADERQKVYAELGGDHYVIFTADRWTVEHSIECRLGGRMHECEWHEAAARVADEPGDGMTGRWRITGIDSCGMPELERAEKMQ